MDLNVYSVILSAHLVALLRESVDIDALVASGEGVVLEVMAVTEHQLLKIRCKLLMPGAGALYEPFN